LLAGDGVVPTTVGDDASGGAAGVLGAGMGIGGDCGRGGGDAVSARAGVMTVGAAALAGAAGF
jgi:hypothetical protein